jgi:hypothetical protein
LIENFKIPNKQAPDIMVQEMKLDDFLSLIQSIVYLHIMNLIFLAILRAELKYLAGQLGI